MKVRAYFEAARRSIRRNGGGLRGLVAVVQRAFKLVGALGLRGLYARLRAASTPRVPVATFADTAALPAPVPIEQVDLRVGVMVHVFYEDLIEEFAQALSLMPIPFTLLVSVVDTRTAEAATSRFGRLPQRVDLQVREVPNRGRDIAPLLVTFADAIRSLDVVGHIHTKKSLYTGSVQEPWRRYLIGSLFGSRDRLAWLFGTLQAAPQLGLIYPETHESLPAWAHTWLGNAAVAAPLAARLGVTIEHGAYFDYPAGSMFWARVDALRPLFDLGLRDSDFPAEQGQTDGTLQHAIERLFGLVALQRGYRLGVLAADGSRSLASEGERNVSTALAQPIAAQLQVAALNASLVTLDVFDTLVTRPFLTPHGARQLLALRAADVMPAEVFEALRDDAETAARQQLQRDPTLPEIYQQLAHQARLGTATMKQLLALELDMERALLRPRQAVVDALSTLAGRPIAALSDMYLPAGLLRSVVPETVRTLTDQWWVSCDTGMRKDDPSSWVKWSARHGVPVDRWLHVGDNELADIQLPQRAGLINPVQVVRPGALLQLVPALRPLDDPRGAHAPWDAQLWRGLLANRFAALADTVPEQLLPVPRLQAADCGYVVLGPLLLDFLLSTVSVARARGVGSVLLLAREGYLLKKAWDLLADVHPQMHDLQAQYFLVSRKATALPALAGDGTLAHVLSSSYNGTLNDLLRARLGAEVTAAVAAVDASLLERAVFLPEMAREVEAWLQPALPAILAAASDAQRCWKEIWAASTGSAPAMVVDLGYAGTIQCNLARLTGESLGGMYFALRGSARQIDALGWAEARYFDGRATSGDASPILQHDLLLEALLTAPTGQFAGYVRGPAGTPEPVFDEGTLDAGATATLREVQEGALAFLQDVCTAIGSNVAQISLQPEEVLIPLRLFAEGRWQAGPWLAQLTTEDDFSGRGRVGAGVG